MHDDGCGDGREDESGGVNMRRHDDDNRDHEHEDDGGDDRWTKAMHDDDGDDGDVNRAVDCRLTGPEMIYPTWWDKHVWGPKQTDRTRK